MLKNQQKDEEQARLGSEIDEDYSDRDTFNKEEKPQNVATELADRPVLVSERYKPNRTNQTNDLSGVISASDVS